MKNKKTKNKMKPGGGLIWGAFAIIFILAIAGIWGFANRVDHKMREELLKQTIQISAATNIIQASGFTGSKSDLNLSNDQQLRERLSIVHKTTVDGRYLYLLGRRADGTVYFITDVGEGDVADPGQPYPEASLELNRLFDNGIPFVEGPLPDEWGIWVSALVPINDPKTGKVVAVLGLDKDARKWKWGVVTQTALPVSFMLFALVLLFMLVILYVRATNQKTRLNELRLRKAELASKTGNWELVADTRQMNVSEGVQRLFGIETQHIEFERFKNMVLPEYLPAVDAGVSEAIINNKPLELEFRIKPENAGIEKDIYAYGQPDSLKGIVFGIFQDITELRKTEAALRESELKHRLLSENVTDVIWTMDLGGRFTYISSSIEKLCGYTPSEAMQQSLDEMMVPGSAAIAKSGLMAANQELKSGKPIKEFRAELEHYRKDGSTVWADVSASGLLNESGEFICFVGITRDNTEKRQAEIALQKSAAENKAMILANPDLIFRIDKEGTFIGFHAPEKSLLYTAPELFMGKKVADILPPDVTDEIMEKSAVALHTNQLAMMHYELTVNGLQNYYENRIIPLGNDELLSFVRDITEQKRAEQDLLQSEERFRSVFENTTVGLYRTSPEGKILMANPSIIRMLGFETFAELANRNLEKEGYEASYSRSQFRQEIERVGEIRGLESAWLRKDQSTLFVRESARLVRNEDGTCKYFEGTVEDITERKLAEGALRKSEEKYRILNNFGTKLLLQPDLKSLYQFIASSLHERFPDAVVLYNSVVDDKNESCLESIVGIENKLYNKLIEIACFNPVGRKYEMHPEYLKLIKGGSIVEFDSELADFARGVLSQPIARIIEKLLGIHKIYTIGVWNKHTLLAAIHFMALKDQAIDDLSFIEAYLSISGIVIQKKMAEDSLIASEIQLKELNATKDKFFSIIAHDLKSPFNSILGLSDLLVEQIAEKDYDGMEEYARIIQKSSSQAYGLLVNLLDWSRSQTSRMEFSPEYVEMGSLIHEVIELFVEQAIQKSITIFEELPRNMLIKP